MYIKPIIQETDIWANNPPSPNDIIKPQDSKIAKGFVYTEIPKHSNFNWMCNTETHYLAHSCKYGIPEWDAETEYEKNSLVLRYDSANSTRNWYISVEKNKGQDPLTSSSWKMYLSALSELQDVVLDNLQTNDLLYYDEIEKVWKNKPNSQILSLKSLSNVQIRNEGSGNILTFINASGTITEKWINLSVEYHLRSSYLESLQDVAYMNVTDNEDLFAFDGTSWTGMPIDGFVEYEDIFAKPISFNPIRTTETDLGGFRTVLKNTDELYIFSYPIGAPNPPSNLNASDKLTTGIEITWDVPVDNGEVIDFYRLYKDGNIVYETPDETVLSYTDTAVEYNEIHVYYVTAINQEGESLRSNTDTGVKVDILPPPNNFNASDNLSDEYVRCSWEPVDGALFYNLYKDGKLAASNITEIPFDYYTLPNQTNDYCVKTVNNAGESTCSNTDEGSTLMPPGEKIYDTNGNFIVPNGIAEIEICMIGGGGSGAIGEGEGDPSGGGYRGEYKTQKVQVQQGDMIQIQIGAGGKPPTYTSLSDGGKGGNTIVTLPDSTVITANGGSGGQKRGYNYRGEGKIYVSPCDGKTYKDGLYVRCWWWHHDDALPGTDCGIWCYGGQASPWGNGGSRSGTETGVGAGGTAISKKSKIVNKEKYCDGGHGRVLIRWGYDTN